MKCRAAVLHNMGEPRPYAETKPVQIEEIELLDPGPGEVLVRMASAGLCHSDLSIVNGSRPREMPIVLGHEGSGVIEAVGPGVDELRVGDHVVYVFVPSCGHCVPCAEGRPALCEPGAKAAAAGTLLSGGRRIKLNGEPVNHQVGVSCFAEYAVSSTRSLVRVDPEIPLDQAALFGCAVITGMGAVVNTAKVRPGAVVAVIGLGGTGLAAVLGARAAGASRIIGLDLLDSKLESGRQIGVDDAVNAGDPDVIETVREMTAGGVEFAFECVGSSKAMELAYAITRRGGTTTTSGLPPPDAKIAVPHVQLVAEERTVKGSYLGSCVPRRDIPAYIDLFRAGRLPIDRLVSDHLPLDKINEGFDRLDDGDTIRQMIAF